MAGPLGAVVWNFEKIIRLQLPAFPIVQTLVPLCAPACSMML
jgi:hypothetical protein